MNSQPALARAENASNINALRKNHRRKNQIRLAIFASFIRAIHCGLKGVIVEVDGIGRGDASPNTPQPTLNRYRTALLPHVFGVQPHLFPAGRDRTNRSNR